MFTSVKAPEGARNTDLYEVTISACGKKEILPVYLALVSDGLGERPLPEQYRSVYTAVKTATFVEKAYIADFSADGEVDVRVEWKGDGTIKEIFGVTATISGKVATFRMKPHDKVLLRPEGDTYRNHLCLSSSFPVKKPTAEKRIEFPAGNYTAANCPFIHKDAHGFDIIDDIEDGTTVYSARGAVIHAGFVLENKHAITLCGEGIIDTLDTSFGTDEGVFDESLFLGALKDYTPSGIYIKTNSSDIKVEGLTLNGYFRGITVRNSDDILVRGVKIFSGAVNADGISMVNVRRMRIEDCFIRTQDDTIAVFTSCDSILYLGDPECKNPIPLSEDIEVSHCTLFTACRNFCIGGHSTGSMNPRNILRNFYAHDIAAYSYRVYEKPDPARIQKWSGALRILSQTEQDVSGIRFENISFTERPEYTGKLIHIEVRSTGNASYTERGGYRIRDVFFRNIVFSHKMGEGISRAIPSVILSDADSDAPDYGVFNVTMENVTCGGIHMENTAEFLTVAGHTENIVVK